MTSNRTPGSGRRKRTRTEDDALPSSPVTASSRTTDAATSAKRRRLNGVADSPRSTPKGFSAIASAIGGVFSRSRGRNGIQRKSAGAQDNTVVESSYDVPESEGEEEEETFSRKPKKLDFGTASKVPKSTKSLYDVPDSGDEQDSTKGAGEQHGTNPGTPSKRKVGKPKGKTPSLNPTPARRGRPPKPKPIELLNMPAVKARIYGPAGLGAGASRVASDPPKLKGILTPQKRKVGRPTKPAKTVVFDEDEEQSDLLGRDVAPKPRWSALMNRSREQMGAGSPAPAVLDQTSDSQRNEAENDGKDPEEAEPEAELEAGEDDDEVCAICSKPDSEPPNEIIFCEVCDRGFHQKCYDVPVIPEGDWICRTCSQDDILPGGTEAGNTETRKKETPTTTVDIPGIPNFEQHLQKMRQVLLERCSGNRRIKLRGQSEAYEKAFQLVEQTVLAGEGNSMMVIGSRGCGKTTVCLFLGCLHHGTTNEHNR